jgi:sugar/nucleoside kinase (ribokinase family)
VDRTDIAGIGTALVDFTPMGISPNGNLIYECNPGGSIANFLVVVARNNCRAAFIGKVGDDKFGRLLEQVLIKENVDVKGMNFDKKHPTSCSFVTLSSSGERTFKFYRKSGADSMLRKKDIPLEIIDRAKVIHVTSFVLTSEPSRSSVLSALRYAKEKEKIISFDINWRPNIWINRSFGKRVIENLIDHVDILKVSEEELYFFAGGGVNIEEAAKNLISKGVKLLVVTCGAKGSYYYTSFCHDFSPAYPVKAVDTTGAGDCHFGTFMSDFIKCGIDLDNPDCQMLSGILSKANAKAAENVSAYGGMANSDLRQTSWRDAISSP